MQLISESNRLINIEILRILFSTETVLYSYYRIALDLVLEFPENSAYQPVKMQIKTRMSWNLFITVEVQ